MEKLLSTRELAEAIGASESSLRRWTDAGAIRTSRTVGGHRRIPLSEAIRFIRETHATVVRPQVLGLPEVPPASESGINEQPSGGGAEEPIHEALLNGDAAGARGRMLALYLGGMTLAKLFDVPVARALHRIGELWHHGPRGVLVEHRATDICLQAVSQLRGLLPRAADDAPAAVGGAPAGDPYVLPSLMAAAVLAEAGYRETNLGADTPADVLAAAAEEQRASLVWLSSSVGAAEAPLQRTVEDLSERLAPLGATLLVGGRQAGALDVSRLGNVRVLATMSDLATFAGGAAPAPKAGPAGRRG